MLQSTIGDKNCGRYLPLIFTEGKRINKNIFLFLKLHDINPAYFGATFIINERVYDLLLNSDVYINTLI